LSADEINDVRSALEELGANAKKHGNKMNPDKSIRIRSDCDSNKLRITVEDDGDGFDMKEVFEVSLDENLCEPRERGIAVVRALMDEVEYNDKGNGVTVVKTLQAIN